MNNRLYDVLKFVAQIFLPAVGTLYFALAGIWDLSYADQVVGTIISVDTFLGVLLGISSKAYNASDKQYDGVMTIHQYDDSNGMFELNFPDHPSALTAKNQVLLKVESHPTSPPDHDPATPGDLPPVVAPPA